MNEQGILDSATQAAEWLFDRRERLEKHEEEPLTLLWLLVSEIDAIIDSFDALEAHTASQLTSACYAMTSSTGSEEAMSRKAHEALLPPEPGARPRRHAGPPAHVFPPGGQQL